VQQTASQRNRCFVGGSSCRTSSTAVGHRSVECRQFGGRGNAYAALLGIVVIQSQSISSGLTLLNLSSSFRFIVTGLVLALAVALDSVARRSRAAHGRA